MWIDRLWNSTATHAIRLTARFAEERHKILAENMANIDTPDYRMRRLDPTKFQSALSDAIGTAKKADAKTLKLRGNAQFSTDDAGRLEVSPTTEPPAGVLFHDGSNTQLESLVSGIQENSMTHRLAVNMLRGRFDGLMTAIRGRMQ
jgi:flagellar basal-body rod protein FlgB